MEVGDSATAAALTPQEKEQLKEKLALLKREYYKTFHRLQRAERAVKVKNYIKKTVAEQNLLLSQEEVVKNHAGSLNHLSPGPPEEGLAEICSESSTAEATPVLLKPKAFEDSLPEMSGSGSTRQAGRRVLFNSVEPSPGRNCSSMTTGQRSGMLSLAKSGESVWEAAHQLDSGYQLEHEVAVVQGSNSPVFQRRSSILEIDQRSPPKSSLPTSKEGSSNVTPKMLYPDCEQRMFGQTDVPGVTQPLPCVLSCASQISLLDHPSEDSTMSGLDNSAATNIAFCANVQNEEEESVQVGKEHPWVDKEDPGKLADLAVTSDTVSNWHSNDIDNGEPPTQKSTGKDEGHNLEVGSPPLERVTPSKKMLSSCTVVEGLMFPVEYYVRTTRRLSSCQKAVNLEAVIQSQLGKGRKGRRAAHKEQAVTAALSSEELSKCDDRLSLPPSAQPPDLPPKSAGSNRGHVRRRKGQKLGRRTKRRTSFGTCQPLLEDLEGELSRAFGDNGEELYKGEEKCSYGSKAAELTSVAAGSHKGSKQSSSEGLVGPVPLASVSSLPSSGRSQEGSDELHLSVRKPSEQTGDPHRTNPELVQQGQPSLLPLETPAASLGWKARPERRRSPRLGSQGAASLGLLRMDSAAVLLPFLAPDCEGFGWLPSGLACREFHLPDEEFGHLKSKKLKVCPKKRLEICDAGGFGGAPPRAAGEAPLEAGAASEPNLVSVVTETPLALSSHELLLSPALEGGHSLLQSLLPTPDFPLVGATPAPTAPQHRESSPDMLWVSPLQTAVAISSFSGSGTRLPCSPGRAGTRGKEAAFLEEEQLPAGKPVERDKEPPSQNSTAEDVLGVALGDIQRKNNLQMTSKLKNGSGSCLVDVSAVWWEAAGFAELCIMTAEETSVSLWRPLDFGQWGTVHTWHFTKFPVIEIVPLPGAHSVVCVALGRLETAEIRLLFHSSEDGCVKEQLVKAGNINAVLGLTDRKLVCSSLALQGQEVEVFSFCEVGRRNKRWGLRPPEETVLAFADVAGVPEAVLGMTAMNCIALWNLGTGQLLKKMPVGWSFPTSICHKAYSDSGLLFMVLSHPHATESKLRGNPAFQIVALNPKTARSIEVMLLPLPPGIQGRYLEGDVRDASAAAVLAPGTIAVWDLFWGQCTALLPPNSEGSWTLARWSVTDACLLAGQEDGTVYLYRYTGSLHSG